MSLISRLIPGLARLKLLESSKNVKLSCNLHVQKPEITPTLISQTAINNSWIWENKGKVILPIVSQIKIDLPEPLKWKLPYVDAPVSIDNVIEAPSTIESDITKQAARLIVIRRKKMKKHKLRKLRKRMKFEWAKRRQRRELKKEKAFQAVLIQQCKEADAFSAEEYVQSRIDKLNEVVVPRYLKGKRLPEFLIREKLGLPPKQ